MAVPKRKISRARKGKRRSHLHRKEHQLTYCGRCETPIESPHYLCSNCGWSTSQKRELVSMEKKKE